MAAHPDCAPVKQCDKMANMPGKVAMAAVWKANMGPACQFTEPGKPGEADVVVTAERCE